MLNITKRRVKTHFTYSLWQYVLLIGLAFFFWDLLYTTTRYQPPEEKKVDFYYEGGVSFDGENAIRGLLDECLEKLYPDMEESDFVTVGTDETYGDMQLTVWISAAQGDLYLLSRSHFQQLAPSGTMLDLQPYIDSGELNVGDISLSRGYVTDDETGERVLRGIPGDALTGMKNYGIDSEERVYCILTRCGNDENVVKLLNEFIRIGTEGAGQAQ